MGWMGLRKLVVPQVASLMEVEMTVFVNPEPTGANEWVIRVEVWKIGSPQLQKSFGPTTVGGG